MSSLVFMFLIFRCRQLGGVAEGRAVPVKYRLSSSMVLTHF
jgi:hypothetical protein